MSSSQEPCYLGIDVGTGSARAALVSTSGAVLASHTQNTQTWRDKRDARVFEQSTSDIWGAICTCVQTCLKESGVSPERVQGVGFDATCSLAVVDGEGNPITVSRDGLGGTGERNIVLWADHRAEEEAETINASGAVPLDFVGGTMSVCPSYQIFPQVKAKITIARDGDPEDSLAQETHDSRCFL
jgi:ribulose kinase